VAGAGPAASATLLSVSMIVRNEARRLPGFLDALGGLADEICITDTGSSDETAAIASSWGCRVQSFSWCDDFAAARNEALRPCTGAWILNLDADEIIARDDHDALRALARGPRDRCYRFVTRNYTQDPSTSGFQWASGDDVHAAGYPGWFPSSKVRLFPNIPGIAFEGAVHEMIHGSLARLGVSPANAGIAVHHYPFLHQSPEAHAAKQSLYLALGRKKAAESPNDPRAHHELGDQYMDLGDFSLALASYKEAVRLEPRNPIWLKDLGSALLLLEQVPHAVQALALSAKLNDADEDCWRNLGIAHVRLGDWPAAQNAFERAQALNPAHPETQRCLAIARQEQGDTPGALALLESLLERFPGHPEARALYDDLQKRQ